MSAVVEENYEEDRRALLQFYSSKSSDHNSYLLTLTVVFFAFVQTIQYVKSGIARNLFVATGFSVIFAVLWYVLLRAFFWGTLSSISCNRRPISIEDYCKIMKYDYYKDIVCITTLERLNFACVFGYMKDHRFRYHAKNPIICLLLGVLVFVIVYLSIPLWIT